MHAYSLCTLAQPSLLSMHDLAEHPLSLLYSLSRADMQGTGPDQSRQYISALAILFVAIFIGFPIWWKTTEVYRCPLPFKEIGELAHQQVNMMAAVPNATPQAHFSFSASFTSSFSTSTSSSILLSSFLLPPPPSSSLLLPPPPSSSPPSSSLLLEMQM